MNKTPGSEGWYRARRNMEEIRKNGIEGALEALRQFPNLVFGDCMYLSGDDTPSRYMKYGVGKRGVDLVLRGSDPESGRTEVEISVAGVDLTPQNVIAIVARTQWADRWEFPEDQQVLVGLVEACRFWNLLAVDTASPELWDQLDEIGEPSQWETSEFGDKLGELKRLAATV